MSAPAAAIIHMPTLLIPGFTETTYLRVKTFIADQVRSGPKLLVSRRTRASAMLGAFPHRGPREIARLP
jgi:hypothetical protein